MSETLVVQTSVPRITVTNGVIVLNYTSGTISLTLSK